jgi:hypothetical protein
VSPADRARLPLWLRVMWRRQHPEFGRSATKRGPRYPDVLTAVYVWMLDHQDFPVADAAAEQAAPQPYKRTSAKRGKA